MKTHTRTINGHQIAAFKDPSTISGEWVIRSANFGERYNARKFTMKESIASVAQLEAFRKERNK